MATYEDIVSSFPYPPKVLIDMHSEENYQNGLAPLPPPIPKDDAFTSFNMTFTLSNTDPVTLESQNVKRLIPVHFDRKKELKKLNHSLVINFLELLDVLIKNPENPMRFEKLEDIKLIFIHMHYILNQYRPHQARETLRSLLQRQLKQKFEILHNMISASNVVRHKLTEVLASIRDPLKEANIVDEEIRKVKEKPKSKYDGFLEADQILCNIIDQTF